MGTQVTQVVKAYAGGNNEAWAAVLLYRTVQCRAVVQYSNGTVRYSSAVVYGTIVQSTEQYSSTYSSSTVPGIICRTRVVM